MRMPGSKPCPKGCQCGSHYKKKCEPGCECGWHTKTLEHRKKIGQGIKRSYENKMQMLRLTLKEEEEGDEL